MNDLGDEPVKKEDEGMESEGVMDTIEGVDEKNTFNAKISNTEIQDVLDKITMISEKTPNNQNIKLEHNLLTKANETVARINLEISNIYRVCRLNYSSDSSVTC